jgi:hypothetical protein
LNFEKEFKVLLLRSCLLLPVALKIGRHKPEAMLILFRYRLSIIQRRNPPKL